LNLNDRIEAIAHTVAKREATHFEAIAQARRKAEELHGQVDSAIGLFNATLAESAPYLQVEVSPPRIDDKHLHAVTVKSKGEVTLVGPFRAGKKEGPCRSFPVGADADIADALSDFLAAFLEEACSP